MIFLILCPSLIFIRWISWKETARIAFYGIKDYYVALQEKISNRIENKDKSK